MWRRGDGDSRASKRSVGEQQNTIWDVCQFEALLVLPFLVNIEHCTVGNMLLKV